MRFKSLKCHVRLKLGATLLGLTAVAIMVIVFVLKDKFETYHPLGYMQASITCFQRNQCGKVKPVDLVVEDKILVIPAILSVDMSWVAEELPEYACDNKFSVLQTTNPSTQLATSHLYRQPLE